MNDHRRTPQIPPIRPLSRIVFPHVLAHIEQGSQRIEDLSRVDEVTLHSVDAEGGVGEVDEVEIEDLVSLREEVRDDMAAGFPTVLDALRLRSMDI